MFSSFFIHMDPLLQGYLSLSKNINKAREGYSNETAEGAIGELIPELKLSMSDDELITLKKDWESAWSPYQKQLASSQNDNETYWLGKQYEGSTKDDGHALVDNLIFESLETFLPIATRPKADPVVTGDDTPEGKALSDKVRKMLIFWADNQAYNLKLKQVCRFWSLYKLGVMKIGWSNQENDISVVSIRPQKLILDPDSTIECGYYTGEYIGEYRKDTARNLIKRFPSKKEYISDKCQKKFGTKMQYIEWWTDDYVFWTMDDEVLAKAKNPHWNYGTDKPITDEMGAVSTQKVAGKNHFKYAKKPYAMLSVFSLGMHPFDDTNLIQQSLPLQDLINKRLRQINKNADKTNGGLAVSGDSFTKEQAAGVSKAVEKGGTIFVPNGDVNRAVVRLDAPALPNFIYESLLDYRNELRNIFGVRGSTAQGTIQDKTVRGKLQIKGQDGDRIGGGISTYLEQFSDVVYNYVVQMMYVYYDEEHVASIIGQGRATEFVKLKSADFVAQLSISVKDGSMIPKDPVSQREEVMGLWEMGAVDPITFFEKLDFPDPQKSAQQLFVWKANPMLLFPEVAKMMPQPQPDPAQQAQADKIKPQGDMQIQSQKAQSDAELQKQKAEIDQTKGIEDILNTREKHDLDMEKQRQAILIQQEKAKVALEQSKKNKPNEGK